MPIQITNTELARLFYSSPWFSSYCRFVSRCNLGTDYAKVWKLYQQTLGNRNEDVRPFRMIWPEVSPRVEENYFAAIYAAEEFFEMIGESPSIMEQVEKIIKFKGDSETMRNIVNEDRIIRAILQWFWNKADNEVRQQYLVAYNEEVTQNTMETERRTMTEGKVFDDRTDTYNIIHLIGKILEYKSGEEKTNWRFVVGFLDVRNRLRNATTHSLEPVMDTPEERVKLAEWILLTYMACFYALRRVLEQREEIPPFLNHLCQPTIYCNDDVRLSVCKRDGGAPVELAQKSPGIFTCTLDAQQYTVRRGTEENGIGIPEQIIRYPFPLIVADASSIRFFASPAESDPIGREVITDRQATAIDDLTEASRQQTEATAENTRELRNLTEATRQSRQLQTEATAENTRELRNLTEATRQTRLMIALATTALVIILCVATYYWMSRHKTDTAPTPETAFQKVEYADDILATVTPSDSKKRNMAFAEAGKSYRSAITQYREMIEKGDSVMTASMQLARLYISGKGSYAPDSALLFLQREEVAGSMEAQGLLTYAYLLNGNREKAEREVMVTANPDDPYVRLTTTLLHLYSPGLSTTDARIELSRLRNIALAEARYEEAAIIGNGIRKEGSMDEYVIEPDIPKQWMILCDLCPRFPRALMPLACIHNIMYDHTGALSILQDAFACGMKKEAALLMNQIFLNRPDIDGDSPENRAFRKEVMAMANAQQDLLTLTSDYMHYSENGMYEEARDLADSIAAVYGRDGAGEWVLDTTAVKRIRVVARLETGDENDFREAVRMAMALDQCDDSTAVALYLQGVCLAKGYGGQSDIRASDSLISLAADRNTYPEALYTRMIRNKYSIRQEDGRYIEKNRKSIDIRDLSLLEKSQKLACGLVAEITRDSISMQHNLDLQQRYFPYLPRVNQYLNQYGDILSYLLQEQVPLAQRQKDFYAIVRPQMMMGMREALDQNHPEITTHLSKIYSSWLTMLGIIDEERVFFEHFEKFKVYTQRDQEAMELANKLAKDRAINDEVQDAYVANMLPLFPDYAY